MDPKEVAKGSGTGGGNTKEVAKGSKYGNGVSESQRYLTQ